MIELGLVMQREGKWERVRERTLYLNSELPDFSWDLHSAGNSSWHNNSNRTQLILESQTHVADFVLKAQQNEFFYKT